MRRTVSGYVHLSIKSQDRIMSLLRALKRAITASSQWYLAIVSGASSEDASAVIDQESVARMIEGRDDSDSEYRSSARSAVVVRYKIELGRLQELHTQLLVVAKWIVTPVVGTIRGEASTASSQGTQQTGMSRAEVPADHIMLPVSVAKASSGASHGGAQRGWG